MIRLLCSLMLFSFFSLQGFLANNDEKETLERFFKILFYDSEAGYVFFGQKPVCITGFRTQDFFMSENEAHFQSVCLAEGALLLKQIHQEKNGNFIVHIFDQEDSLVKDIVHILVVNKKEFLEVVDANLSLFQYVLGPKVTPQGLLEKLLDPKQSFHSALKSDKVLIGILLGFGTQSSLWVSRLENLEELLFSEDSPPFKSRLDKFSKVPKPFQEMLLMQEKARPIKLGFDSNPSFGYSSLNEEINDLSKEIAYPSEKLAEFKPRFIFGQIEGEKKENKVKLWEKTQDQIIRFIESKSFLDEILTSLNSKKDFSVVGENRSNNNISHLVALNIWKHLEGENRSYCHQFIKGIEQEEKIQLDQSLPNYKLIKAAFQITEKLNATNQFFDKLEKDPTVQCIYPKKLYAKILKKGEGSALDKERLITAHYTFKCQDKMIADSRLSLPVTINLAETIPGFFLGVKGMKRGEEREIYIHPSLAYGIHTCLGKGNDLIAKVTLIDFDDLSNDVPLKVNLIDVEKNLSCYPIAHFLEQEKIEGFQNGYRLWQHYKKNKSVSKNEVVNHLQSFLEGKKAPKLTREEEALINRIHYEIYLKK